MTSDGSQNSPAIPVAEFEGELVRSFEGRLPALTLDMPEGYVRGTHLKLELEVRVRNVHYDEDKEKDLTRMHQFALEEVRLTDAFDPASRPNNVGGNLTADSWEEAFLDFVHGDTDELDFEGEEVPERLKEMLKAYFDAFGGVSTPVGTPSDEGVGF